MGKNSPPAPDYTAAAEAQAQGSQQNTTQQTWANRPTQNTPFGQTTWQASPTWDPVSGSWQNQWTQNTNLTPQLQAAADAQMDIAQGRSEMGRDLLGRASEQLQQGVDWSNLPQAGGSLPDAQAVNQRGVDAAYGQYTSRLDPQWQQRESQARAQLYNQGLREGDAAFDQQTQNLGRERTDAYQSAMNSAVGQGQQIAQSQLSMQQQVSAHQSQLRQQAIAEQMQRQGWDLNFINAALAGQQVGMPQMPGFQGAGQAQAPQYMQAAQNQYGAALDQFNAQQAQIQGLMQGGSQLGAAYLMSDERLKDDVQRLDAEAMPGVPLATWKWKDDGSEGAGVIAQDVERVAPEKVRTHASGFKMVRADVLPFSF